MGRGDAFHQGAGVGVQGIVEEFMGGCPFDDAAGIHDVDDIAGLVHDGEIVGDQDDGGAEVLLSVFNEVEHLFLHGDIERGGGFIANEELGSCDESHGNHDALAHTTGEFVRVRLDAFFRFRDADFCEGIDCSVQGLFTFDAFVDF